jgi:hypothetical protein
MKLAIYDNHNFISHDPILDYSLKINFFKKNKNIIKVGNVKSAGREIKQQF